MAYKTNRKFNSVEGKFLDSEYKMIELKRKQKMDEERKNVKEGQSTWDNVLRQDQERCIQTQLGRNSLAGQHLLQITEKAKQKAQEKRETKKDLEKFKHLDKLHAEEQKRQEEQKPELRRIERKKRLQDISRMNSYREEEAERLRKEEEKTRLVGVQMEGKLLHRKEQEALKSTRHRLASQTVWDKLASSKKDQAAATAARVERSLFKDVAKRQAEHEKLQKEMAKKKTEALQSISAHNQKMIQERQQREEAERQSNVTWLQDQKKADNLFHQENKLKAQRTREEKVQVQKFNDSLEAEKLQGQQALTRKDREAAINPLSGGVSFSSDEASSYLPADAAIPLQRYIKGNRKQEQDCKRLGKITLSIPDFCAMPQQKEAVDINDTEKQLDTVKVFTQGHKDMEQLRPTPPPAELRSNSQRCSSFRKLIRKQEAVSVNKTRERRELDRENQVLAESRKKKMAEEEDRKNVKEGQSTFDEVMRQDQERNIQTKLHRNALAGQHLLQMTEKAKQKAQETLELKKDLERFKHLDKLHAEEQRRQEEQKPELKKIERKNRLQDISRMNSYREEEAERLGKEDERIRLVGVQMEGKLLHRKEQEALRSTRHRLASQPVWDKLASSKKDQAAATAARDEQSLVKGLAKRQAEQEKLQKEKAEKKTEALQSISAHNQKMIQERQQREEAERQSNVTWLQDQKRADNLFHQENKLKAQRTREEKVQVKNFNDSLKAEKLQGQQALMRKDHEAAMNPLGGGVSLSCDDGSGYLPADAVTPLKEALEINDTEKQLETVKVFTPPQAELRTNSKRCSRLRQMIIDSEAVSVNNTRERRELDRENQVLAESRKQKMAEEEDRKNVKEGQSTFDIVLRQDQERYIQNQLRRNALAGQHLLQMTEKAKQKAQETLEIKKDLERFKHLDELHAEEQRRQEEQKPELRRIERKNRLQDISRMNSYREEEAERLGKEDERTKLVGVQMEGKLLHRKEQEALRSMRHRLASQPVWDKLASSKKEQAAATAARDEQSLVKGLAKRQAEQEKLQKEKAEKKTEALQSISAHNQKMIQERQQREEAERQSNVTWLQDQKRADNLFHQENKLKAQKTRAEKVQVQNFNDSLEAEKLQGQQALMRKDSEAAINPLGGGVSLSCDDGSGYLPADAAIPLQQYIKGIRKQEQDRKRLGKITLSIPDFCAMPQQKEAVDINDTEKQLDTVKVFTQGHKDMVQLRPTPPPAELRSNSQRCSSFRKLIRKQEAVSVNKTRERRELDRENQVLAESRKKKMAEEEDRQNVKEGQSTFDEVLRQDQERYIQNQLRRNALAGQHLLQMTEKAKQKAQETLELKKDLERFKHLDELHAEEQRRQEEQKPELKKIERKNRLQDISRMNSYREEEAERLGKEEERTKLVGVEMEGKLLHRKEQEALRSTRHRLASQPVRDKLASSKKEQAAATAARDEQSLVKGLAKRQAEQEKLQKEKAEKKTEALQSISAHNQKMIQERQQREEAERQSNVTWLQDQKKADNLFHQENKLKAQRTREEKVQVKNFNDSLKAEKIQGQQALMRKDHEFSRNPLGGGVSLSCGEVGGYRSADTFTPLQRYIKTNRKQHKELRHEDMTEMKQVHLSSSFTKFPPIKLPLIKTNRKQQKELRHEDMTEMKQVHLSSSFTKLPPIKLPPILHRHK